MNEMNNNKKQKISKCELDTIDKDLIESVSNFKLIIGFIIAYKLLN